MGGNRSSFVNRNSGLCLDVPWPWSDVEVVQWECHGGTNQQFFLQPVQNAPGFFRIQASNVPADHVLEVPPNSTEGNPPMRQHILNGKHNQEFRLEPV